MKFASCILRHSAGVALLLVAALTPALFSQTVTFAPQGAAILKNQSGQVIKGVQILDLNVCAPAGVSIPNGFVYQTAVANGFSAIGPTMGTALLNQKIASNWKHWLVQLVTDGALDAAIGGLSGVISIPSGAIKGLAIGHAFMDKFSPQLLSTAPTPAALVALMLDPSKTTSFATAGCIEATMLATYTKGSKAIGPVLVSASPVSAPAATPAAAPAHDDEAAIQHRIDLIAAMHEQAARFYEKGEF